MLLGWASDLGMYIVIDLHGAPFAQDGQQPFTGQMAATPSDSNPDFYQTSQYQRALQFLGNMTQRIHTNSNYRNVGMLEIVNEPITVSLATF
jgi:glucan endo-1,6-beta-glucosidase